MKLYNLKNGLLLCLFFTFSLSAKQYDLLQEAQNYYGQSSFHHAKVKDTSERLAIVNDMLVQAKAEVNSATKDPRLFFLKGILYEYSNSLKKQLDEDLKSLVGKEIL